ncbi:MAG: S41 family peptidase, partial [Cytophagaceae bacterium]
NKILKHPRGYEDYISLLFFNSITTCFDAHSHFMSKEVWKSFRADISKETDSFGFSLEEDNNGNIIIANIVPGGPAWKSNELHKGDVIMQVSWENGAYEELLGSDLEEVEYLLQNTISSEASFKTRKKNGLINNVTLIKEKLEDDENIVKSFILEGEHKIGFISLPGFYTEWENLSGLGCANDVAKEIIKLKKEGIEGLILDLRYNGGGSLEESLNLAGIFIDEGPLFILKERDEKPKLVKDMNRGTIYDGPLLVMVNGESASASELVAATLQDYNRAIITGSQTFGKATGQAIIPLDTNAANLANFTSPYGLASTTVYKLYRITGASNQARGLTPDITIPDHSYLSESGESKLFNAFHNDSVAKKVYYKKLPPLPVKQLSENSLERIRNNPGFQPSNFPKENYQDFPLYISGYLERINTIKNFYQEVETAPQKTTIYKITNLIADQERMMIDVYGGILNKNRIDGLLSDITLEESYNILCDYIKMK